MTTKQLAEALNVHSETVRRMRIREQIPFIKVSDTEYRYNYEEVIEALKDSK